MHALLKRLGFTWKKNRLVPSKADAEAQTEFICRYRKLLSELGPDDHIYFADAAHFVHNAEAGYAWSERGKPHIILANSGRSRYNVIGVYCVQTQDFVCIHTPDNINGDTVKDLMTALRQRHPAGHLYVILDNVRYQHRSDVAEHCQAAGITLVFLPTYSPNLNAIERFWKFLRKKVFKDRYYANVKEFVAAIKEFLQNLANNLDELASLVTDNFEIVPTAWTRARPADSQT